MKYALYLFFVILNLVMILKVPESEAKLKYLKMYAIGIPLTFGVTLVAMLLIKAIGLTPTDSFRSVFMSLLMSVLTVLLINCMIIAGTQMVDLALKYHADHNAANSVRFPITFVVNNQKAIKSAIKIVFFLGSLLAFYGIWLGKKL